MSLCPDVLFHRDPECFRHFLERICPLRGFLDIADALVGELRQHNISCHNRPPWLEACATWHEEGARRACHNVLGAATRSIGQRSAADVRMRLSATAV